tara:strand:- start:674 stop:2536 length:1863 start_codon:yes stop_codon:yes gene_type:complete
MKKTVLLTWAVALIACDGGGQSAASIVALPAGLTPISDIQGSDDRSPLLGQKVTISGIVTGDFQDNDADRLRNLGGFFVQQATPDSNPRTAEGIFVFDGNNPPVDVCIGDRVEVDGSVAEHFGETQINASSVTITGNGSIDATEVNLPARDVLLDADGNLIADLERYEGMLLRFPQALTVSNLRYLEQFGEVGLSQGGRLFQFTNSNPPSRTGYADHKRNNAARSIVLDDGRRNANPLPVMHLEAGPSQDYSLRMGDSVSGITGNLRYSRGSGGRGDAAWRLMPTQAVVFDAANPRPAAPELGGTTRVASANVLNFFSGVDRGAADCGPRQQDNCRGADSREEQARQLAKTATVLSMMNADIVGLIELENNARSSIVTIVDALNKKLGATRYDFVDTGVIGEDAIKTGFIYDATRIRLHGSFAILDASVDSRFNDRRNRPALAQSFEVRETGAVVTVVVNHLKSKGSSCEADGDPNNGDGQGNCNLARTNAAKAIADWIATDPTGSGDADFLVIGDLNAYLMEDPLTALKAAGMINLLEKNDEPYSFSFDGQSGALDHALASSSLAPQVVETIEWKINSDEPALLDYNLENDRDTGLFDPDSPYRAADHDPVIVGLELLP